MERLRSVPQSEPEVAPPEGGGVTRAALYGALAVMLAGGAWVRFGEEVGQLAPGLAPPAVQEPERRAKPAGTIDTLVEAEAVPAGEVSAAIAAMKLPPAQSAALVDAVKQDRLRLVTMPLFDAGLAAADGTDAGRAVLVRTGGFSRVVMLTRQPAPVVLPIDRVGTVTFEVASAAKAGPVGLGALTATGPVRFPDLSAGDVLDVGVMAQ